MLIRDDRKGHGATGGKWINAMSYSRKERILAGLSRRWEYKNLWVCRHKARIKHGGELQRLDLTNLDIEMITQPEMVLAINDALERFASEDALCAELVKLRYFAGLSVEEAGKALSLSRADAYRHWKFARAWLQCELSDDKAGEQACKLKRSFYWLLRLKMFRGVLRSSMNNAKRMPLLSTKSKRCWGPTMLQQVILGYFFQVFVEVILQRSFPQSRKA